MVRQPLVQGTLATMNLGSADTGTTLIVVSAPAGSAATSRRLAELGIRPGARLRIVSRTSGGGAIVAIGDDRLAVSHAILTAVEVTDQVPAHG